jgi:putative tricarboxylic transport membrane protein
MSRSASSPGATVGQRWPEVIVAGALMLVATLVIVDSLRVGIGWAPEGPRAGYFPFYIGLLLFAASAWVLVGQLLRWREADEDFAHRSQIASVLAVLVPTVVYVGLIMPLGLYVASFLLIAYFMRRYGKYRWRLVAAVAVGVPLAFFLVFERWFLVPLPKGPLEHLFGL